MWTKVIRSVTFLTDILSHSEYILAISVVFIIVGYVCPIMVKIFGESVHNIHFFSNIFINFIRKYRSVSE